MFTVQINQLTNILGLRSILESGASSQIYSPFLVLVCSGHGERNVTFTILV